MTAPVDAGIVTTTRSPRPTTPVLTRLGGAVHDEPTVDSPYWVIVIAFVAIALGGAEWFLRNGVVWQVPLEYLLQDEVDHYTRSAWLVHHPPESKGDEIIVLGSSTAAAITELPGNESQEILRTVLDRPGLQLVSLPAFDGCYPEHLTLLENALEQGHQPIAVILFSWPNCFGPSYDDTRALLARRMPLVSPSLADLDENSRSLKTRIHASLVRASAIQRYRHTVNAWLRSRWEGLLLGQAPWKAVAFKGKDRAAAWKGAWELEPLRHERFRALAAEWTATGPASRQLAALLELAKHKAVPVLIIESPWSPTLFDVFRDKADIYFQVMRSIAVRGGATYVDPNRPAPLSPELFNDPFHANYAGARAYMPIVASELRRLVQTW